MATSTYTPTTTLFDVIKSSWTRTSSYDPEGWDRSNPALGQCAITALVVQDYLGGELRRASDGDKTTHYWGVVDGREVDLTLEQFDEPPTWTEAPTRVDREHILAWPDTRRRYIELRDRVAASMKTD